MTDSLTRQSNRAHDLWLRHQALRLAALWKRLDDRRSDARYSVGAQLHLRGGEAEFASASRWCRSRQPRRREMGAFGPRQLGTPKRPFAARAEAILLPMLADRHAGVRAAAVAALGHNGRRKVAGTITTLAGDRSSEVRLAVARALGSIGDAREVGTLLRFSRDPVGDVRSWTAFALRWVAPGDARVVRRLAELVDDPHEGVRDEVEEFFAGRADGAATARGE